MNDQGGSYWSRRGICSLSSSWSCSPPRRKECDEEDQALACSLVEGLARLMLHQELQLQMSIRTGVTLHTEVCKDWEALINKAQLRIPSLPPGVSPLLQMFG